MHQFALRLYSKLSQTIHERLDAFTVLVSFDSTLTMFGLDKNKYPLNVIFQSSNESSSSITQKYIIQNVQLKYDLPKELFIIIKPEQIDIYQKCFAFVLQVKQAKYVLDQLMFSGMKKKSKVTFDSLWFISRVRQIGTGDNSNLIIIRSPSGFHEKCTGFIEVGLGNFTKVTRVILGLDMSCSYRTKKKFLTFVLIGDL
jgi:hypothetical protein